MYMDEFRAGSIIRRACGCPSPWGRGPGEGRSGRGREGEEEEGGDLEDVGGEVVGGVVDAAEDVLEAEVLGQDVHAPVPGQHDRAVHGRVGKDGRAGEGEGDEKVASDPVMPAM